MFRSRLEAGGRKQNKRSTNILRCADHDGLLASLDAESLFTNVPVDETIQIILRNVYRHELLLLPPPSIPETDLEMWLPSCTTESPFRSPDIKLYRQISGVAMGSPSDPVLLSFACAVGLGPIYCQHVGDVIVVERDEDPVQDPQQQMEVQSVLHYAYKVRRNHDPSFPDVDVTATCIDYTTTVHRKPTDLRKYMNPSGE